MCLGIVIRLRTGPSDRITANIVMNLGRSINASDQLNNYYITKDLENVGRCDTLTSQHLPLSRAKEESEQEN